MASAAVKVALKSKQLFNISLRTLSESTGTKLNFSNGSNFPLFSRKIIRQSVNVGNSYLTSSSVFCGSAARAETTSTTQGLSKLQAQELVLRLTTEERTALTTALKEFQSKVVKDEYEAEGIPKPTNRQLAHIGIANSIPFIGFGFLDNFFMILFGDYIDFYLGSYFTLTTMAAAALGNTFSDVLGIGTAFYVERLANRIGFDPPKLTPIQMDMSCSRHAANLGRVIGVTIGCLLGMFPLLFFKTKDTCDDPELAKTEKKGSEKKV